MKIKNFNYDVVKYVIDSYKLKKDEEKIILIADLHNYTLNRDRAASLAEKIKLLNPHHIIIAGDIMQGNKWNDSLSLKHFQLFLANLSEAAPIFLANGNHDLAFISKKESLSRRINYLKLEKVRNGRVFPLINNRVFLDDFEVICYTPPRKIIGNFSNQINGLSHDCFINEYQKNGVKIKNSDKFIVEFVGHNPYLIVQSMNGIGLEGLKEVDTFYAGHFHNGYIPSCKTKANPDKYLDSGYTEMPYLNDLNGNIIKKSINPLFFGKINLCRGVIYFDDRCRQYFLELNNNHFYQLKLDDNNRKWHLIDEHIARRIILDEKLHSLVITGGVRKFFGLPMLGDNPEITEVVYRKIKK